ncbi:MAG: CoA ester lyase [Alphaproteobacteria bacterium]
MAKPLITLFTPGNRPDLIAKAPRYAPDAIIVDLEDSVPAALKAKVRGDVAALLPGLDISAVVRVNSDPALLEADLEAVVSPHIQGLYVPMVDTVALVQRVDAIVTRLERERAMEPDSMRLVLIMETALGVHRCYDLVTAAKRVDSIVYGSAEDADLQRDLKCAWSSAGPELMYGRGKVLLECRAAGLPYVLDGAYSDINDDDGLRADCVLSKRMGYDGRALIHPRQVAIAREVYAPNPDTVAYYRRMVTAFEDAEARGLAAIAFEGKLVDYAMYKKAKAEVAG